MIDIKAKDGTERANVKIGCFPALWKTALILILVFNFGKILDFISILINRCH